VVRGAVSRLTMNALFDRTRRLPQSLAADLRFAADQLDADAEALHQRGRRAAQALGADLHFAADRLTSDADVLRETAERRGVPSQVVSIPQRIDRAAGHFAEVVRQIAVAFDVLAHRLDALRPGLLSLRPARAERLARTLGACTALVGIVAVAAFATLAGPHARVPMDRVAGGQAPARLQALATDDAGAGQPAGPTPGVVEATGGAGPAVPAAATPAPEVRTIPASRGALPIGKGMWIWTPERSEGGDAVAIVNRAKAVGLTHLYVRTGALKGGFIAADFLNRLLPVAHAANIRVYGWDFPYLNDIDGDVARAAAAANHLTPDGHRIDGFSADIELRSMGVNINNVTAFVYGQKLRAAVGRDFPLIATVPRPNPALVNYPFAEIAAHFDALAPMVYWMHNEPAATVTDSIARLAHLQRPILPVGQAYDAAAEGGPAGVPGRDQILAFMKAAEAAGAPSVSWWSWQHADQQAWDAVRDAPEFVLTAGATRPGAVRAYQVLLTSLGFPAPVTGVLDEATANALADYQRAARLPVTGVIDDATFNTLLTPFPPPIRPGA
jgi:Putative peptidoglycan binding domain